MAYNTYRERPLRFTGTLDTVLAALPAGTSIFVHAVEIFDAAASGTLTLTDGAGLTMMSSADIAPTATGLKRNTTPGPYFLIADRSITADVGTALGDAVDMVFYCSVAKVRPGAGEV